MRSMRRNCDSAFKAKVALEALKGEKSIAQLSSEYGAHPNQIGQWKKRLLKALPEIFSGRRGKSSRSNYTGSTNSLGFPGRLIIMSQGP